MHALGDRKVDEVLIVWIGTSQAFCGTKQRRRVHIHPERIKGGQDGVCIDCPASKRFARDHVSEFIAHRAGAEPSALPRRQCFFERRSDWMTKCEPVEDDVGVNHQIQRRSQRGGCDSQEVRLLTLANHSSSCRPDGRHRAAQAHAGCYFNPTFFLASLIAFRCAAVIPDTRLAPPLSCF